MSNQNLFPENWTHQNQTIWRMAYNIRNYAMRFMPSSTNSLNKAIIDFLQFHGHRAWRNNTQGTYNEKKKVWIPLPSNSRGIGDIICVLKPLGRHLEIETKRGADKLSPEQIEHRDKIIKAGGLYWEIKNIDEFIISYHKETLTLKQK